MIKVLLLLLVAVLVAYFLRKSRLIGNPRSKSEVIDKSQVVDAKYQEVEDKEKFEEAG